jgi:hypothetical protein
MAISIAEGSDNINIAEKAKIYKNPKTEYEEAVNRDLKICVYFEPQTAGCRQPFAVGG